MLQQTSDFPALFLQINYYAIIIILPVLVGLLVFNFWLFRKYNFFPAYGNILKWGFTILATLAAVTLIVYNLFPDESGTRNEILKILGIVVSAGFALSSTTILGNLLAGFMNNAMQRFRNGDLIKTGDLIGRVTKQGAFHIEIQTEDSNFITIPNLFIATNPVKMTRNANTVISTSVSLGYDVSRVTIEEALNEAAVGAGLSDPYVYIKSLNDFSVVYTIHGFLKDSGSYFSASSKLNKYVLDALHRHQIEIVSPTFMNTRRIDDKEFIPEVKAAPVEEKEDVAPDELVFDEAIKSGKVEKKKDFLKKLEKNKAFYGKKLESSSDDAEKEKIKERIASIEKIKKEVKQDIEEQKSEEID